MKLFKLLTVLFLASMFFGGCAGMQLKKEVASVPDGHMRVSIINNTDVVMCHNTAWLNHNVPDIRGPGPVCGGEIQPGGDHTFDRNISSWHFEGTRIYGTSWYMCRPHSYGDEREELEEKYRSRVISEIPENTAIIKIYHKHYKAIPR